MFLGRENELKSLASLLEKRTPSLVVCRGRRRIGKSTLFEEFARRNNLKFLVLDGLMPRPDIKNEDQLRHFCEELSTQTKRDIPIAKNWTEAFCLLDEAIAKDEWSLVLLDEISWMGKYDPDFPGTLKSAWDLRLKKHSQLVLALCGSVSAWIRKNILDNTGFVGRFSRDIVLRELSLPLCRQFWGETAERLAPRDIIDVLAVTGGVPRYLEEVNPSLSANDNIRNLCFTPDGTLFQDFKAIFSSVFGEDAAQKRRILELLADGSKTCSELAAALGVERGGSLAENIDALAESGFVSKDFGYNPETCLPARQGRYRISDNYTRFYLKYVAPHEHEIQAGRYAFTSLDMLPGWDSMIGLQFENLVINNVNDLLPRLHFDGVPVLSAVPYVKHGKRLADGSREPGLQIDLLVQSRKSVCIVEVKHQSHVGEAVEQEVAAKLKKLKVANGVSKRTALVYCGELAPVVRGNGFFDAIISSSDLLSP